MPDPEHQKVQSVLKTVFEVANGLTPRHEWVTAYQDPSVAIAGHISPTSSQSRKDSCLYPDVAVGPYVSTEDELNRSPESQHYTFPTHKPPPDLVIEVTSSNRIKDLTSKYSIYAERNIPEYIIVDQEEKQVIVNKLEKDDRDCGDTSVRLTTRKSTTKCPSERRYRDDELVESSLFSRLKIRVRASDMLDPLRS